MAKTHAIIDETTRARVAEELVRVERQPSTSEAYFVESGHCQVLTANGELMVDGPVWILWDTKGLPYPLTPEEFEETYLILPEERVVGRRRPRLVEPSQGFRPDPTEEEKLMRDARSAHANLERYRTKTRAFNLRNNPEGEPIEPMPTGDVASRWRWWVRAYYHNDVKPPKEPGALASETFHVTEQSRDMARSVAENHSKLGEVTWGAR